jgi:Flp pilus assembly protein TadG
MFVIESNVEPTERRSRWRNAARSLKERILGRRLRHFALDIRGIAAIEAGLSFPFIVALAAGLIEFGRIFYSFELMQTGVRDAARYLARTPNLATAENAARNIAIRGTIDTSGTLRVTWWQVSDIQIAYKTTANPPDETTGRRLYRGGDPIVVVRVATAVDYAGLGLLNSIGLGPVRISAAHEERYVGE